MAAGAWITYDEFVHYMGNATINLATETFSVHLFTSASNALTTTLSTLGSLTNELASARGYTLSGKTLGSVTWSAGASAGDRRFDAASVVWSASGGNLGSTAILKFAAIVAHTGASAKDGANKLVCVSQLSTSGFAIADGNTLTIDPAATGIFEIKRA